MKFWSARKKALAIQQSGCSGLLAVLNAPYLRQKKLWDSILLKARFWKTHSEFAPTERQRKVLNRLLDAGPGGFEGGLSTRKYMSMTKHRARLHGARLKACFRKGYCKPYPAGGRSTAYEVAWEQYRVEKQ